MQCMKHRHCYNPGKLLTIYIVPEWWDHDYSKIIQDTLMKYCAAAPSCGSQIILCFFFFRIRYNVPVNLYHGYGNGRGFELWSVCGNVSKWASSCLSVIVPVSTLFRCWKRFIGSRTIVVARKCRALWASYYGVSTVHLGVRFQRMEPAFLWNVLTVKTTGQGHIINAWISIKSRQPARNNKNIAMGLKMRIIV